MDTQPAFLRRRTGRFVASMGPNYSCQLGNPTYPRIRRTSLVAPFMDPFLQMFFFICLAARTCQAFRLWFVNGYMCRYPDVLD